MVSLVYNAKHSYQWKINAELPSSGNNAIPNISNISDLELLTAGAMLPAEVIDSI